ncbi:hypothetical protein [Hyalangium sp.]|uniref:hypothetical protein n=1 Tax=Hyalangium sp. TaxID=2028555 RepID=UPI002D3C48F4|nr:hypothetical protein [Hyalangium sp.]HYI02721.1 hypothetical protein [Hyalangium sp.]
MKKIITTVRSCRLFRPITLEEAKTLCLTLSESMARNHEVTGKMARPFRLRLYTVKTHLTKESLLLHIRFLVGSKKERTDIILGCFDAHVERMLRPCQRDPPAP